MLSRRLANPAPRLLSSPHSLSTEAIIPRAVANAAGNTIQSGPIQVIDGDTVRFSGAVYRLIGFDTPERGDKARCDDECRRAETATTRLRAFISSGDARLIRVACSCRRGQEGTRNCNYGRLCGSLTPVGS